MDDLIVNKAQIIERCIQRIKEDFGNDEQAFKENFTKQDAVILNIQRAIHACVDMANVTIRKNKWDIPQSYRDCFKILENKAIIKENLSTKLQNMVSFRNIAVHDYQKLNIDIVVSIVNNHLIDISDFKSIMLKRLRD